MTETLERLEREFEAAIRAAGADAEAVESAVHQPKVIQQVLEYLATDTHRDTLELGEVRQSLLTRVMTLREHHRLAPSVQCSPLLHTALQCAPVTIGILARITLLQILQ